MSGGMARKGGLRRAGKARGKLTLMGVAVCQACLPNTKSPETKGPRCHREGCFYFGEFPRHVNRLQAVNVRRMIQAGEHMHAPYDPMKALKEGK